ncbi:YciI family protein [Kitasatospora sp. LaBMicrA B282]|uniref:YciI family protein n=1 Tax=Kitasatospora sp. LaBMicrA B282 TaxID=3420949 RepID=UPI003D0F0B57
MEYLLLIHGDERVWDALSDEQEAELDAAHARFGREMYQAGVKVLYGGGLARGATARLVVPGDDAAGNAAAVDPVSDGPYREGHEHLGGVWVIDVGSEQEAVDWARRMPAAAGDLVEVRPVRVT